MQPVDKSVNREMLTALIQEIDNRIPAMEVMYKNKKLRFHFTIEDRNMIDEWNIFCPVLKLGLKNSIKALKQDELIIDYLVFCKVSYFIYFFSLFFQVGDESDKLFYAGAEIYLKKYFNKIIGEPFDHAVFYKNAFPISIKNK